MNSCRTRSSGLPVTSRHSPWRCINTQSPGPFGGPEDAGDLSPGRSWTSTRLSSPSSLSPGTRFFSRDRSSRVQLEAKFINSLVNYPLHGQISRMIPRIITPDVERALSRQAAVALIGPRQVGKTTLALEIARSHDALYLDLEDRDDRNRLAEPALFLDNLEDRLVILDEVHRMPELFQSLRGIIDRGRRRGKGKGRFLILGSASIDMLRQSGETTRTASRCAATSSVPTWNATSRCSVRASRPRPWNGCGRCSRTARERCSTHPCLPERWK